MSIIAGVGVEPTNSKVTSNDLIDNLMSLVSDHCFAPQVGMVRFELTNSFEHILIRDAS